MFPFFVYVLLYVIFSGIGRMTKSKPADLNQAVAKSFSCQLYHRAAILWRF
jgi:hypothetical protein